VTEQFVNKRKPYRDAIFVVTEEQACPIYNVGEEIKVENLSLVVPESKPACLMMVREVMKATGDKEKSFERFSQLGIQKSKFDCGGCEGLIRFEFKKEKGFATLQMKLLAAAELKRKMRHMDQFFDLLRDLEIFESLNDDALSDLTAKLRLHSYPAGKIVLKKGDPGTHLYIVLGGKVSVVGDDGQVLREMEEGEIFGEMSLLSGEPVTTSIHTKESAKLATLSAKDFKHVLNKYPVLQVFFYRMLVERAQANTLRKGNITSGMSGELSEISPVDLLQLINSSTKTGMVNLELDDGKARVLFSEGELVQATYNTMEGKEALFALLGKRQGRFIYHSGIPKEAENAPILGGFMGLIMEGMRRIDEQVAGEED
jgi:CRP-like cAMP-binding protein